MTNLTNIGPHTLDWNVGHLSGWAYQGEIKKWFQGTFRNLHALARVCPTCQSEIKINVTAQALTGHATNHGLSLRRCKKCREALKTGGVAYEVRKRLGDVAGPHVAEEPAVTGFAKPAMNADDREELERLREWEPSVQRALRLLQAGQPAATMLNIDAVVAGLIKAGEEMVGRYGAVFAENSVLKAKLAKYELPQAMAAMQNKMPWES